MDSVTTIGLDATNTTKGRIEVITGCMFASKTKELINRAQLAEIAEKNVMAFKPHVDDRYNEDRITTHDGGELPATPIKSDSEGMEKLQEEITDDTDVIVIDEANFFCDVLVSTVEQLADDNYRVILSGLDQTFRGDPFEPLPKLLALADHIEKRRAICESCGNAATRTQRLINGEPAPSDSPTIDVGGDEKYEARCRKCHEIQS